MKKSTTKKSLPIKTQLLIERAKLRAVRQAVGHLTRPQMALNSDFNVRAIMEPVPIPGTGPARFIHLCPVYGRPVMQALDEAGQVWESVFRKATPTTPEERWWEPISMERREKKTEEVPAS